MTRRIALATLLAALLLAASPAARAHEDEEPTPAYDLVRQAIALIVNTPGDMPGIEDKLHDATEAEDQSKVRITLVREADEALESGDMHEARALLERSIGARVHTGAADPVPIGHPAPEVSVDTGTVAAIDAMPGRGALTALDWIMLGLSIAAGLTGVALSLRLRPRHLPHPGPTPMR